MRGSDSRLLRDAWANLNTINLHFSWNLDTHPHARVYKYTYVHTCKHALAQWGHTSVLHVRASLRTPLVKNISWSHLSGHSSKMLLRCTNVHKSIRFHSEHLSTCSDFILLSHLFFKSWRSMFPNPSLFEPAWLPDYSSFDDLMSAFSPLFFIWTPNRRPTERPAPLSNKVNIQSNLSHIRAGSRESTLRLDETWNKNQKRGLNLV